MTSDRLSPQTRRAQILSVALIVAEQTHYLTMTRGEIADAARITPTLITHYFQGGMDEMRARVMREAITRGCLPVLAQGLTARDRIALNAPLALREAALNGALNG